MPGLMVDLTHKNMFLEIDLWTNVFVVVHFTELPLLSTIFRYRLGNETGLMAFHLLRGGVPLAKLLPVIINICFHI